MRKYYMLFIMIFMIWLVGCSNNTPSKTVSDILQNKKEIKLVNYNNEVFLNNDKEIQNFKDLIDDVQVKEISRKEFKEIFQSHGEFREKRESLALFVFDKENNEEPPTIVIEITSDGNFTLNEMDEEGMVTKDYLITEKDKVLYQDVKLFLESSN